MYNDAYLLQLHACVACNFPLIRLFKDTYAVIYSNLHHLFPVARADVHSARHPHAVKSLLLSLTLGGADGWGSCLTEVRALKIVRTKGAGPQSDWNSGAADRMEWTPKYLKYSSKLTKDPQTHPQRQPPS